MEAYSVLMSVYSKVDPQHFREAVQSMMEQSVLTNDFVLVCDGPLTVEQEQVLEDFCEKYPGLFHVVRLPENLGIGPAAAAGLEKCKNDLVAKMDSDDIAVHNRCQLQLELFEKDPELIVAGGVIEEFDKDPNKPFAIRAVPETNEEIRRFARRRQPFNNVSVMYRRSAVLAVGGYRHYRRCEDYDMYVRLLHAGYKAGNLSQVLVKVRVNNGALSRRSSWPSAAGCIRSRWYAFRIGYSSLWDFLYCAIGQLVVCISPVWLQQYIYRKMFREKCNTDVERESMQSK